MNKFKDLLNLPSKCQAINHDKDPQDNTCVSCLIYIFDIFFHVVIQRIGEFFDIAKTYALVTQIWNQQKIESINQSLKQCEETITFVQEIIGISTKIGDALKRLNRDGEAPEYYKYASIFTTSFAANLEGRKASFLCLLGENQKALEFLEQSDLHQTTIAKADVLDMNGRKEEALNIYNQLEQQKGNMLPYILYSKVLTLSSLHKYDEALNYLDQFDVKFPLSKQNLKNLVLISMKKQIQEEEKPLVVSNQITQESLLNRGLYLLNQHQYEDALQVFDQALRVYPEDSSAILGKSYSLRSLKRIEEALTLVNDYLKIDPQCYRIIAEKGRILKKLNRLHEALDCFDNALKIETGYVNGFCYKGDCLSDMNKLDDADNCYIKSLELDPKDTFSLIGRGNILQKKNLIEKSLKYYIQALEIDPQNATALQKKGDALRQLNHLQNALECYEKALQIDSSLSEAVNGKGLALQALMKQDEALKCFDQAINLEPQNYNYLYNRSLLLCYQQKYEEALDNIERIQKIQDFPFSELYFLKALILFRLQKYSQAIKCCDKAKKQGQPPQEINLFLRLLSKV